MPGEAQVLDFTADQLAAAEELGEDVQRAVDRRVMLPLRVVLQVPVNKAQGQNVVKPRLQFIGRCDERHPVGVENLPCVTPPLNDREPEGADDGGYHRAGECHHGYDDCGVHTRNRTGNSGRLPYQCPEGGVT
jgi:hypothetical protein